MDEEPKVELSFPEMMLSDIAEDVRKIRRNTSFLAGVLLGYMVLIVLLFVLNIAVAANSS